MTISVVQLQTVPGALSGSFATPTTAGNCVIVVVTLNAAGSAAITSVTLGGGADHFIQAVAAQNPGVTKLAAIWVDPGCAGGQTAVAVSGTNLVAPSGAFGITLLEVAGLATSNIVDQFSGNGGDSANGWFSGATAATQKADEFWIGANSTNTTTTQPAWTNFFMSGAKLGGGGYLIVSSTGSASFSGTQISSSAFAACVATLNTPGTTVSGATAGVTVTAPAGAPLQKIPIPKVSAPVSSTPIVKPVSASPIVVVS